MSSLRKMGCVFFELRKLGRNWVVTHSTRLVLSLRWYVVTSQWVLPYLPLCGGEGRFMIPVVIHQVLQLKKGAFRVHVCVCQGFYRKWASQCCVTLSPCWCSQTLNLQFLPIKDEVWLFPNWRTDSNSPVGLLFVLLVLVISPGLSCKAHPSLGVVILSSRDSVINDSIVAVKWEGISFFETRPISLLWNVILLSCVHYVLSMHGQKGSWLS